MDCHEDIAPLNFNRQAALASIVVPGRLKVRGVTVYSTKASAQFILFFDSDVLPAEGTVPLWAWNLAAHAGVGFGWQPNGRQFQTGLCMCNSSTDATKTIGSADTFFDVQFDVYEEQNAPGTGA